MYVSILLSIILAFNYYFNINLKYYLLLIFKIKDIYKLYIVNIVELVFLLFLYKSIQYISKKLNEYHEKGQYFLSLISESETHILYSFITQWNVSSL